MCDLPLLTSHWRCLCTLSQSIPQRSLSHPLQFPMLPQPQSTAHHVRPITSSSLNRQNSQFKKVRCPIGLLFTWARGRERGLTGSFLIPTSSIMSNSHPCVSRSISTSLAGARLRDIERRRSRLVKHRGKQEQRKIKAKDILVIDETGENLGEMSTELAFQIAEGKGLELVQVQKESEQSKAVCKFVSKKQLYEAKREQKQQSKKDPQQVIKEIPISTKIGPHDLEVKVHRIQQFLEKKYHVRVNIEATFRKFFSEAEVNAEKKLQLSVLKQVEQKLEGLGSKVNRETLQGKKLVCSFKPVNASSPPNRD